MALSPAEPGYGLAGRISEQEEREHLLAQAIVELRNRVTDAGMMGRGTIVISLEPEDGTSFEMVCSLADTEMRLTPVLVRSRRYVSGPVPG